MSTTKLGQKAKNSLREKRRANPLASRSFDGNASAVSDEKAPDLACLESDASFSSAASNGGATNGRSYSFFDPEQNNTPGSPTRDEVVSPVEGSGSQDGDAASVATARAGNHATAAASLPAMPPLISETEQEVEVKYEEGGSELFMLVEDAKWDDVVDRVEQVPHEAKIWVTSSGTENTLFSWSVWRRLPFHEACRRQPPPVVIYALLAAYPESAMVQSNFGELPLHAAVRCGACCEVVNCIIASYPAAVMSRDNSGCTPLDILNGTGKMMDHDSVVAALNRTIAVLTRDEQVVAHARGNLQLEFKQAKEKRKKEYERIVASKNSEIENLKRLLEQEKLATSNLASKVIQTEQVVQDKSKSEQKMAEMINRMEDEMKGLRTSNTQRKAKIKDLEDVIRSNRNAMVELSQRIQSLERNFESLVGEEELFASHALAKAEYDMAKLMEGQLAFFREAERRKDSLRARVAGLAIDLPKAVPKRDYRKEEEEERNRKLLEIQPHKNDVSDREVAEKAMASALVTLRKDPTGAMVSDESFDNALNLSL
mmetsp:Transcript_32177/g.76915  ORF Transcript_32177/g.76915 Transcript_32177/m.76915 type:complete len:542 (+) Transcript_32177:211-1836(+)